MPPVCGGGWMDVEPILSPRSLSLTLTLSSGPPGLVWRKLPSNKFCVQYIFYAIERHPAMGEPFGGLFLDAATPASQQEQCLRSNTTITCRFGRNSRIAEWVVGIRPDQWPSSCHSFRSSTFRSSSGVLGKFMALTVVVVGGGHRRDPIRQSGRAEGQ